MFKLNSFFSAVSKQIFFMSFHVSCLTDQLHDLCRIYTDSVANPNPIEGLSCNFIIQM